MLEAKIPQNIFCLFEEEAPFDEFQTVGIFPYEGAWQLPHISLEELEDMEAMEGDRP